MIDRNGSVETAEMVVQDLRDWAYIVDESQGKAHVGMLSGALFRDAADEIERLSDENSALRKAVGEEGRANRMTLLYESAQNEIERLLMEASYGWG